MQRDNGKRLVNSLKNMLAHVVGIPTDGRSTWYPPRMITFQQRVNAWVQVCFGARVASDTVERNHRFLEEALELVQACGCIQTDAHLLVDYVYGRPAGDKPQEVGGVLLTLAALCQAQGLDMQTCGNAELSRAWDCIDLIRAKQSRKPRHSPLPGRTL